MEDLTQSFKHFSSSELGGGARFDYGTLTTAGYAFECFVGKCSIVLSEEVAACLCGANLQNAN